MDRASVPRAVLSPSKGARMTRKAEMAAIAEFIGAGRLVRLPEVSAEDHDARLIDRVLAERQQMRNATGAHHLLRRRRR